MVRSATVKRTSVSVAVLVVALVASSAGAQQNNWYASRMTFGEAPVFIEHFWSRGVSMRAQSVIRGRPLITLVNERRYIIIDSLAKKGISIERGPVAIAQDAGRKRPFGNEGDRIIAAGAERVGGEVLGGQDVDRYRLTGSAGRSEVWVTHDDLRVPIQVLRRQRKTGSETRLQYLDWDTPMALPDHFFEPERDVELEVITYDDYVERSKLGAVGPAPPFYADLLHGVRE
jgi:hypothetical protein